MLFEEGKNTQKNHNFIMWWGLKHDIIMKVWFCCTCTTESQFHLDFVLEKKCTMESHFHLVFFFRKKNVQRKCDSVAQCTMESYFCCTFFFSKKKCSMESQFRYAIFFCKKKYTMEVWFRCTLCNWIILLLYMSYLAPLAQQYWDFVVYFFLTHNAQ